MEYSIDVLAAGERKTFTCASTERLLYAALRAGIELPFGCATGTCGGCRTTLNSGTVHTLWADAPGNRALKKPTDVLSCQSVPTSDCALEVRAISESGGIGMRPVMQRNAGVLTRVEPHADGLAWVEIELDTPMQFLAGQFVLLRIDGVDGYRAYSPATDGSASKRLCLVVREAQQGAMSPKLCTPAAVGLKLEVLGPLGVAHVRTGQDQDMAVVAGGSGCSVALAVIDWAEKSGHLHQHRIDVVVGLRSTVNAAVLQRLSTAVQRWPERLGITLAVSDPVQPGAPTWPGLTVEAGMAHEVAARNHDIPSWKGRALFVAGPEMMVQATLRMLMKSGKINPTTVRFDSFS